MALSDSKDIVAKHKFMMSKTCMWHKEKKSFFYICFNWFWILYISSMTAGLGTELFYATDDYNYFAEVLSLFITPFSYILKHIAFDVKSKTFVKMMKKLEDPIFKKYPERLDVYIKSNIKFSYWISTIYQVCCGMVICLYSLKPFVTSDYSLPFNLSMFELGNWKYLAHFWQSTGLMSCGWNNSCLDTVSVGFMLIGSSHFDIIYDKILNVRQWAKLSYDEIDKSEENKIVPEDWDHEVDDLVSKRLSECVKHHIALLDFLMYVEEVFSLAFLVQFLTSIVVICNTGFQVAHVQLFSVQFFIMILYFAAMMMQLALYCWFGNELMVRSIKIRDACYLSEWPSCGVKVRKSLFIIMERTKRPFQLTASKFASLSLQSFTSVMHSSYSYFALMQRLYANENKEL